MFKNFFCGVLCAVVLAVPLQISCSIVKIHNATIAKIEANLDIVSYPDPKKTISPNSIVAEDISSFFMRGINISVHIGNYFIENVLKESLFQTLGFGGISYHIFMEIENLGRTNLVDEHLLVFTFYLVREPKYFYSGGIVSKSNAIKVRTTDFENFTPILLPDAGPYSCENKDKK